MILWTENGSARVSEGYGYASDYIKRHLIDFGLPIANTRRDRPTELIILHDIPIGYMEQATKPSEMIVVNNSLPDVFTKSSVYSVGFTYWETNRLKTDWVKFLNESNEVWTVSKFMADVFHDSGVQRPIYDFQLGVNEKLYYPKKRFVKKQFTFLSIGSPSSRKNSQMAVDAFIKLFGDNEDFALLYKSNGPADARLAINGGIAPVKFHPRIKVIDYELPEEEFASIYDQADCLIYPTSGEGWGLIPFQAIAKGLPTICTNATACTEFAEMSVPLDYKWSKYKMSGIYDGAGEWAEPNFDDLCDKMLYVVNNYREVQEKTYKSAQYINKNMTWAMTTKEIADRLWQILKDTKVK